MWWLRGSMLDMDAFKYLQDPDVCADVGHAGAALHSIWAQARAVTSQCTAGRVLSCCPSAA